MWYYLARRTFSLCNGLWYNLQPPLIFLCYKWYTLLTIPELTCCVSNQKMFHFIWKENSFIQNCFFPEKYLQTHFWHTFWRKILFLLSQKVTSGCAEVLINARLGNTEGIHVSLSLQTGINWDCVVISALRLEALLKKLFQTWGKGKKIQVEVERTIIFITSFLLLNLFKLLLS